MKSHSILKYITLQGFFILFFWEWGRKTNWNDPETNLYHFSKGTIWLSFLERGYSYQFSGKKRKRNGATYHDKYPSLKKTCTIYNEVTFLPQWNELSIILNKCEDERYIIMHSSQRVFIASNNPPHPLLWSQPAGMEGHSLDLPRALKT